MENEHLRVPPPWMENFINFHNFFFKPTLIEESLMVTFLDISIISREKVRSGDTGTLEGDGYWLAVQEEGAGGWDRVPLPQQQAHLGGAAGGAGGPLYLAPSDRHDDVVAPGYPRL